MLRAGLRVFVRSIPVLVALAIVGVGAAIGFAPAASPLVPSKVQVEVTRPDGSTVSGAWKDTSKPKSPLSFPVADATGPVVHLYRAPDVPYEPKPTLDNPTWEGLPVVFLVLEEKGPWLHVRVSSRPNALVLWVAKDEVSLRTVPNHVLVELAAHRVTVFHGDTILLQAPAGIGTVDSPTPTGPFFVDGIVKVPDPDGVYGAYQVSVSGFSDVYSTFGGGVGQIALHGTNHPELVGTPVSHGCVRLTNDNITKVAALAPLGTPVDIVA